MEKVGEEGKKESQRRKLNVIQINSRKRKEARKTRKRKRMKVVKGRERKMVRKSTGKDLERKWRRWKGRRRGGNHV